MNTRTMDALLTRITGSDVLLLLVGVGLVAALAQATTDNIWTWKGFIRGIVASFFVILMTWVGIGAFGFGLKTNDQRLWISGIAAFAAKYLLRGFNTVLDKFAQNPRLVLERVAAAIRRAAAVISPDDKREK